MVAGCGAEKLFRACCCEGGALEGLEEGDFLGGVERFSFLG